MFEEGGDTGKKPDQALSRRSLIAAGSVLMTALGSTGAAAGGDRRRLAGLWFWGNWGPPRPRPEKPDRPGKGGNAHCYLSGTRILTPSGPRDIAELAVGDLVTTCSGEARPIKWVARVRFTREHDEPWSKDLAPVKVARFAFDSQTPSSDLYLSPGHCVYLDGVLIPIKTLLNGTTITQDDAANRDALDYVHIELASHELVLAEGTPSETLMASADRQLFDNYDEYLALYGPRETASAVPALPVAPIAFEFGGRKQLRSRLRSAVSPWIDRRRPYDVVRDRLELRGEEMRSAA